MPDEAIPRLGFGTYRLTDPEQCTESVETALDCGYRHVDTAEGYDNEAFVGDGIAASDVDREEIFLATKVSPENLGYDDVLESAAQSRELLDVETLDLLYVHWPLDAYDAGDTLAAFDDLVSEGAIRHVGLSNFTPELLDEARDALDTSLFAHQVEMHPLLQQEELHEYALEHDHYLVAYSPIARGEVFDVPELVEIAEKHDATAAQVSLAWLLEKENVVAIPKATSEDHVHENYGALDLDLDPEDVERIDDIDREERVVDFDAAPWNR